MIWIALLQAVTAYVSLILLLGLIMKALTALNVEEFSPMAKFLTCVLATDIFILGLATIMGLVLGVGVIPMMLSLAIPAGAVNVLAGIGAGVMACVEACNTRSSYSPI